MYKTKITQWGLDKKNKKNEIMAVVRKKTQRDNVGKESRFRIRGQDLDLEKIDRYLKRKRLVRDAAEIQSAPTPPGLECFTPTDVPASPRTPEVFSGPENIFIKIRDYITGSFEAETWVFYSESELCESTKDTYKTGYDLNYLTLYSRLASNFFDNGLLEEGGRLLVAATAGIKEILMAEIPYLLLAVFETILFLHHHRKPEVALSILKQLWRMATHVLSEMHPLVYVFRHLVSLESIERTNLILLLWESTLDRFGGILGPTSYSALYSGREYVKYKEGHELKRIEPRLQNLLSKCISAHGGQNISSVMLGVQLAETLLYQNKYLEAEGMARDSLAAARHIRSPLVTDYQCDGLVAMAEAQSALGKIDLAEASYRQAIQLAGSTWGWKDPWTIGYTLDLEKYLIDWGKEASAAEVRRHWREIIESIDPFV